MGMDESLASVAFPDMALRIFGRPAMRTDTMPKPEVSRWLRRICALSWNRWRKLFGQRLLALNKVQEKVDDAYEGAHKRRRVTCCSLVFQPSQQGSARLSRSGPIYDT